MIKKKIHLSGNCSYVKKRTIDHFEREEEKEKSKKREKKENIHGSLLTWSRKKKRARRKKDEGLKVHRLFEEEVCFNLVR